MTIAALELNDQALLIQAADGALHAEPGYARLEADAIVTGEEARAAAWREPQHIYDQYWRHLNQVPLSSAHPLARHHADIAFAQLGKLWRSAGSPASLIVLVPGCLARDRLSLLLGMIEALPSRVSAVIDSALPACLDIRQDTLYADMQMHELVLTVCRPQGGELVIEDQEVFPGLGMAQLQNTLARHISDLLIENYRLDPLHSSTTEQDIYDRIPRWLHRLRWENSVSTTVVSERGEFPCILERSAIRQLLDKQFASLRAYIARWNGCAQRLSHCSAPLSGLVEGLAAAEVIGQTAATQTCLERHDDIVAQVGKLHRMRRLKRAEPGPGDENEERLATHLLCGDLALPLARPVSIQLTGDTPQISGEWDDGAAVTVVLQDRALETLHRRTDVSLPPTCRPGESIRVAGHELKLIRVENA